MAHSLLLNNTLQESNTCDISNEKSTRHVNISRLQKIRKLDANMSVRLCMNLINLFIKIINDCTMRSFICQNKFRRYEESAILWWWDDFRGRECLDDEEERKTQRIVLVFGCWHQIWQNFRNNFLSKFLINYYFESNLYEILHVFFFRVNYTCILLDSEIIATFPLRSKITQTFLLRLFRL